MDSSLEKNIFGSQKEICRQMLCSSSVRSMDRFSALPLSRVVADGIGAGEGDKPQMKFIACCSMGDNAT